MLLHRSCICQSRFLSVFFSFKSDGTVLWQNPPSLQPWFSSIESFLHRAIVVRYSAIFLRQPLRSTCDTRGRKISNKNSGKSTFLLVARDGKRYGESDDVNHEGIETGGAASHCRLVYCVAIKPWHGCSHPDGQGWSHQLSAGSCHPLQPVTCIVALPTTMCI